MGKNKSIVCTILLFFFVEKTTAQVDTTGISKQLDYYNLELKGNWDNHFATGGSWKTLLSDKNYSLDCKHVFLFEYFARLGLLDISIDIDDEYSVFAHGCNCGNEYLVKKGIKDKIPINKTYKDGMTALHFAIQSAKTVNINNILDQLPDVNIRNINNENALIIACSSIDDTLLISRILKAGANYSLKNNDNVSALEKAYYKNNKNDFYYLLHYIINLQDSSFIRQSKLISLSIMTADTSLLREYLPICEPRIDAQKNIQYSSEFWGFAEFYNLANKYRNASDFDTIPLYNTKDLDIGIAKVLMDHGYDLTVPFEAGQNILFKCREIPALSRFFIAKGIDLNHLDEKGKTFLQYYIDELVVPPIFTLDGLVDYKVKNRDYTAELETLKFYIDSGATVGPDKVNGWEYLKQVLELKKNPYLKRDLQKNFAQFMK